MADNLMKKNLKIKFPWMILISFFIFTMGILMLGRAYYRSQLTRIKKDAHESLTVISNLKIRQIEQWRIERHGNAEQIRNNNPLLKSIKECIGYKSRQETEADVKNWMKSIASNYDYNSVYIYDTLQKIRLSSTLPDAVLPEGTKIAFRETLKDMKVRMTDLYRNGSSGRPTIDLLIPLVLNDKNQSEPFGVMVLRINPEKILYPLIQSWPTTSKSAETLLIRKDGDSVLYLNDLRHIQYTALNLKLPLLDKNLPASKAINGITGVVEGVDYRKVLVLAYISSIPDLKWFMVSKIDREEILAPLKGFSFISVIVSVLLILIVASVLLFWIRNQQLILSREQLSSELERKQMDEKILEWNDQFRKLSSNVPGMIFQFTRRLDGTYCVPIASEGIKNIYGLSPGDVTDDFSPIAKVVLPEDLDRLVRDIEYSAEHLTLFDCEFRAQIPGKPFKWLNTKSNPERMADGSITWYGFISDITDRKQYEQVIQESQKKYIDLFSAMTEGCAVHELVCNDLHEPFDYKILDINSSFEKQTGIKKGIVVGKNSCEAYQTDTPPYFDIYKEVVLTGKPSQFESYFQPLDKYFLISVFKSSEYRFATIFENITERKRAEEEIKTKVAELERFNRLSVGREMRMIELKQKINDLSAQLNLPHPYTLDYLKPTNNIPEIGKKGA
jgi:PAS domain-containing protein